MLVEHFPLAQATKVYQLLHDGKIKGRSVITRMGDYNPATAIATESSRLTRALESVHRT